MLSERLLEYLKEMSMDINQIKETKASRAFRLFFEDRGRAEGKAEGLAEGKAEGLAEGEARGKRGALFAVLAARGLTPTSSEHDRLSAVTDLDVLDRCLQSAATCTTVAAVLDQLPGARPPEATSATRRSRAKNANGHRR